MKDRTDSEILNEYDKEAELKYPSYWDLSSKIEKIVNSSLTEVPWEGTTVNKSKLMQDIEDLVFEVAPEYKIKYTNN